MKTILIKLSQYLMIALSLGCINHNACGQTSYRGVSAPVNALATDTNGNVYAGGNFFTAGNVSVSSIAVWNPSTQTWSSLGNGVSGVVNAIAIGNDGKVYVGGQFSGREPNFDEFNIDVYDPSSKSWDGMNGGVSDWGSVSGIAIAGNRVYVVGKFTSAGFGPGVTNICATNIAAWDTQMQQWYYVGAPPPVGALINTIATSDGVNFYAGGSSGVAMGVLSTDGIITWQRLDPSVQCSVNAIAITPDDRVFFGGTFTLFLTLTVDVVEWDGNNFVALPNASPSAEPVNALSVLNGTSLIIGGYCFYEFPPGTGTYQAYDIAGYNLTTSSWFVLGPGNDNGVNAAVNALAVSSSGANGIVYAGGDFTSIVGNGDCVSYIAAWNSVANAWSILGNNIPPTVSITAPTNGTGFCAPANIPITTSASDDCGVTKVDFYANGSQIGTVIATAPYSPTWNPSFTWSPVPAGTYSLTAVATDTDGAQTTSIAVTVNVLTSPTIIIQPQSQAVCSGSPVTFSVVAGGSSLSYQWKFNNANISGATSSTYSIASVAANSAGNYTVAVSNPCGSINSSTAVLTVSASPPLIAPTIYDGGPSGSYAGSFMLINNPNPGPVTLYNFYSNGSNISPAGSYTLVQSSSSNSFDLGVSHGSFFDNDYWYEGSVVIGRVESPLSTPVQSIYWP
jgi:hypothetical protein